MWSLEFARTRAERPWKWQVLREFGVISQRAKREFMRQRRYHRTSGYRDAPIEFRLYVHALESEEFR